MSKDAKQGAEAAELRRRAEEQLQSRPSDWSSQKSAAETQRLVHELQVHQIELEMQNEELREARAETEVGLERYTELYDFAPMSLFTLGRKGAIFKANLAGARLLGWERARLLNVSFATFVAEADRPLFQLFLDNVFAAPDKRSCEISLRQGGKPDRIVVIEATLPPDRGECRCVVMDITERKHLEQQFLRAQRLEGIGTLAGGIAHDLNNVLGPIMMSLDLLKLRFTDEAIREMLATIEDSAHHGAELVRQLLSLASGVEGERLHVSVRNLLRDIEKLANDSFPKNLQVRTIIPSGLWMVVGDRAQLHQVLLNLCMNARDAMPRGGTLTISAENCPIESHYAGLKLETKPGPYVRLCVEDTGSGMPPEVLERVFDPFFTTKETDQGTGLGLSTSLGIVKSHGGFMQVSSEPGKGAKFSIYLPGHVEPAATPRVTVTADMPCGKGELILVVDDEATVRQVTQQALEAFGYRVIVASDGAEAVAIYASQKDAIAAVLTDMMMPIMDGNATIQVLRKLNPELPIIAASGLATSDPVTKAASLNVNCFLPKPYPAATLLRALREALDS